MKSIQAKRMLISGVICIALFCISCESEQSKQARKQYQEASDQEILSGIESALPSYEMIVNPSVAIGRLIV